MEPYTGLLKNGVSELVLKKSRFIGAAGAVYTEDEALAFIESRRRQMPDAGHHAYAYRLGIRLERYSDDGEPSGTAGLPLLNVLRLAPIDNAVVVVSRYFGGTLLGTGGLVHSYGHAARAAVEDAVIADKTPYSKVSITTDYSSAGRIQYDVTELGGIITDTLYTEAVELIILWPPGVRAIDKLAADASNGRAVTAHTGEVFCAYNGDKLFITER